MFENLNIRSFVEENAVRIHLQWHWVGTDDGSVPACSVFCCPISEQRLLRKMVYRKEDIINWINREIVDVSNPVTRADNLDDYYRRNSSECKLHRYTLTGNIIKHVDITYPLNSLDSIFFICVFGEKSFEVKIITVQPDTNVAFTVGKQGGFMQKLLGKGSNVIQLEGDSSRHRVLLSNYSGETVYSVIPPGNNKYYLEKNVNPEDIRTVEYLSTQIGK